MEQDHTNQEIVDAIFNTVQKYGKTTERTRTDGTKLRYFRGWMGAYLILSGEHRQSKVMVDGHQVANDNTYVDFKFKNQKLGKLIRRRVMFREDLPVDMNDFYGEDQGEILPIREINETTVVSPFWREANGVLTESYGWPAARGRFLGLSTRADKVHKKVAILHAPGETDDDVLTRICRSMAYSKDVVEIGKQLKKLPDYNDLKGIELQHAADLIVDDIYTTVDEGQLAPLKIVYDFPPQPDHDREQ